MTVDILVVVTAHNYARFLPECLDSVLAQEGNVDWKVVVVDDGSRDATPDVLADYKARDRRITSIRLEGVGLASAANAGIRSTESSWVLRLDADDWLHPACLRTLLGAVSEQGVDLVYPDFYLTDDVGQVIARENRGENLNGPGHERSPLAACCLYRRSSWEFLGGYNRELRYQEDFDFWLKFIEHFSWAHVSKPLFYYRQHGISMSTNKKPRAVTRRQVKHEAVIRQGKTLKAGGVPVFISTLSSLAMRVAPGTALLEFGGITLLDRALEKVNRCPACGDIMIITADDDVTQWANLKGLDVIMSPRHFSEERDIFTGAVEHVGSKGLCLLVSPYYPLIEPERLQEVLDTALLFDCGKVDTVFNEAHELLVMSDQGVVPALAETLECSPVVYQQAGGLRALCSEAVQTRGVVEILAPENYSVSGEIAYAQIEQLLDVK